MTQEFTGRRISRAALCSAAALAPLAAFLFWLGYDGLGAATRN
jgi:hypothetical protein